MPYWIYSNRQDDGTMRGPSNSPVTVANVPSYVARSAVPTGGAGAGGGGRGRGGGGAGGGAGARGGAPAAAGAGGAAGAAGGGRRSGARRCTTRQRARPADTGTAARRRTQACSRAAVAGADAAARRRSGSGGIGGCESGFTLPLPRQSGHHLGVVLRQRSDALRRERRTRALGIAVDSHARLRADRS